MIKQDDFPLAIAIMAAGKGTRMKSETIPKVMHTLAGRSMIMHVLHTAMELTPSLILPIVGHHRDKVRAHVAEQGSPEMLERLSWVEQIEQLGTGHAVQQLMPKLNGFEGHVIIVNGDVPLLSAKTLQELLRQHAEGFHAATLLTTRLKDPTGYGRIVKNNAGYFIGIREDKDCDPAELKIDEVNTGIYLFDWKFLAEILPQLKNDNAKAEFYLTDALGMLVSRKLSVGVHCMEDSHEVLGINSRLDLAQVEDHLYQQIRDYWLDQGVTLRNPTSIVIDSTVKLSPDCEILSGTVLQGQTRIGKGSVIGPNTQIIDSQVGADCQISHSVVKESQLADQVSVGPFAHIRPQSQLDQGSKIGNFVELKKTHLGIGSKISHLSYIGDAEIGQNCNIGAGTITCNYDGARKHQTTLADDVFVGSNSTLVAPVNIGKSGYIAAGSVITEAVPAGALGIGRGRQSNKAGWVAQKRPHK